MGFQIKEMDLKDIERLSRELQFFSIHNHTEISNFRLRDAIIRIAELEDRGLELGYKGICCTDHEALSAHVKFLKHEEEIKDAITLYEKLKKQGKDKEIEENKTIQKYLKYKDLIKDFKCGLGNEIYLVDSLEEVKDNYISGVTKFYHFLLLAKDKEGYDIIREISSKSAWKNWFKNGKMERVPTIKEEMEEIIGDRKGHIMGFSACLGGELPTLILNYLQAEEKEEKLIYKRKIDSFVRWGISVFGKDDFYLEIQPCVIKQDEDGEYLPHSQALVNQFIFRLAKGYGLKVCITTDSHYLKKEDRQIHEIYLKADDDEKSTGRELADFYETTYVMEKKEIISLLSTHLTEKEIVYAFNGTMDVYNKLESFSLYHPTIVPTDKKIPPFKVQHIFKDYYDRYEYIKKFAESDSLQDQYLLYLTEVGFEKKNQWCDSTYHFETYDYDGNKIEEHDITITLEEKIARINEEFSSFWQISERLNQKLSAYYVLVRGLVQEVMWKVSFVGVARGSVGGSFIAYLTEITQINPLKFSLPFWRHSSPLRPELPDLKNKKSSLIVILNVKFCEL